VALRKLRGEAYTQFYREARDLAHSYDKPVGLHVSISMDMEPEHGAAMEIHWDWRRWIDEGLADSVTMKEVWPGTRFAQEILSHTRPLGVPVIFCPWNSVWQGAGNERVIEEWIRAAREGGYDGYQFCECCAILRALPDGRVVNQRPQVAEIFRQNFR
jgi:hypothetical protein